MNEKKSFVLYHDIRNPLELLTDEQRGQLFMAILNYSEFGEMPELGGAVQMAFAFIKAAIDRDTEAWEDKREKRRSAGSKGGKQRVANQANAIFACNDEANEANQAVNVPVPVNVPVNVNNIDSKADKPPRTRFSPPSVEEVAEYCRERRNAVDPQRFVDYYSANGWMIGKTKMKDWKAAVRTWERSDKNGISSGNTKPTGREANALFGLVPDVSG